MGKLFAKKDSDGDSGSGSSRRGLFSRKDKSPAPTPAPAWNPYANLQSSQSNPYAQMPKEEIPDPYVQDVKPVSFGKAPVGRASSTPSVGGYGEPAPPPYQEHTPSPGPGPVMNGTGSGSRPAPRFGANSYNGGGAPSGYGSDRYGSGEPSRLGPGGYGGLGRTLSNDTTTTDDNRNALFGDIKQRSQAPQNNPYAEPSGSAVGGYGGLGDSYGGDESRAALFGNAQDRAHAQSSSRPGGYGGGAIGDDGQDYGAGRELTAEELEEQDVDATKSEIRLIKQQDVSATRNALAIAASAEETGRGTLGRLAGQGDRIHNTERNLDIAANYNRRAAEQAKELKTLNRSMFAMHVQNPFTKTQRRRDEEERIANERRDERDVREATRAAAYDSKANQAQHARSLERQAGYQRSKGKASLAERAKYQFEADSEDDAMEDEIHDNLDLLSHAVGRLHTVAEATGDELDRQNKVLSRNIIKTDSVDDQITMNHARIKRIH